MCYHNPPNLIGLSRDCDMCTVQNATLKLTTALTSNLKPLSRANQNRVLLALHAQIAEQLDALTTDTAT